MEPITLVYIFAALCVKHFICDFLLQVRVQHLTRKLPGQLGGAVHAGVHAIGTIVVATAFVYPLTITTLLIALFDGIAHYLIDGAKSKLNNYYGVAPTNSEYFWRLMGLDQLLHYLTYVIILWYLAANH